MQILYKNETAKKLVQELIQGEESNDKGNKSNVDT